MTRRRLLTIAHSYCVALNRRLAHEMARAGGDEWEVVAVAPRFFRGDLRVENHLQQQIAQFFRELAVVPTLERLQHLVGFFDQIGAKRKMGLLDTLGQTRGVDDKTMVLARDLDLTG